MDVIASDGERIGTVDAVEGERIKLTKDSSSDGKHHHVDLSDVARVDEHVHLSKTRAALGLAAAAAAGGGARRKARQSAAADPQPDGRRRHAAPQLHAAVGARPGWRCSR